MKALVLAAGEGTRLRPLTSNIPKPLLPLAGKPYLSHLFTALKNVGIQDITLLVGWKSNRVKSTTATGAPRSEIELSGTEDEAGHRQCHRSGQGMMDEDFICINGDVLLAPETSRACGDA